jgi:hypothetical protein
MTLVAGLLLRGDERLLRFLGELVRIDQPITPIWTRSPLLEQVTPDVLPAT